MDFKKKFESIRIVHDGSKGVVKLELVQTIDQDRATKIRNNFLGKLVKANPHTLKQVVELLNAKLPPPQDGEVVIGPATSGIVLAAFLSQARNSNYNYSIPDKFIGYSQAVSFSEDHRDDKQHYFYGLKPGDRVIIVEDEIWSGKGILEMIKSLKKFGIQIIAVCSVIEVVNFNAREDINNMLNGEFTSLVKIELK